MRTVFTNVLLWLFGIFFTCETIKNADSVIVFKCPLSKTPITFNNYSAFVDTSLRNSTDFWTPCLLPDYSCVKIKVPLRGHLFACIPDFGKIQPALFDYLTPMGVYKVTLEDYFYLSKGCSFLGKNAIDTSMTTVTYQNLTFVTEFTCCKGESCFGDNWRNIWDDVGKSAVGVFHTRNNFFWYLSISIGGTIVSLIVCKLTLMVYQRLRERLVIESLKTISRTLKEADDEDNMKRRSTLNGILSLRFCRKKAKVHRSCSDTSHKTNSVQALIEPKSR